MKKVSIIIPCHNEAESLPLLYLELKALMDSQTAYDWEVVMVNDGSRDQTLSVMRRIREADPRCHYIDLSRNFGKESAMKAGLDHCTGDCAVILDADLQNPPQLIPEMLRLWEEGYDDVYGRRRSRGRESWLRRKLSLAFYRVLRRSSEVDMLENVGDFRLLDRRCIDALSALPETERYTKGLFCWIGYRKHEILFDRPDRAAGRSNWNFRQLASLAVEGLTSFSTAPLRLSVIFGFIVALCAFLTMIYYVVKTLVFGDPIQGFPTLITVILLLGGIQLIAIGILGEYVGKIFNEVKRRPVYLIREQQ